MNRITLTLLAGVLALPIGAVPLAAQQAGEAVLPSVSTLTVVGEATAESVPDMATVTLGATTQAETAAQALAGNNAKIEATLQVLTSAGVQPRDVQTSGLNLGPVYSDGPVIRSEPDGRIAPQIVGFRASSDITFRVRDLSKLGMILDNAVTEGANTLQGLAFSLQDAIATEDEARRLAVADARRKAELYAEAAGVTLFRLRALSEEAQGGPVTFRQDKMMMAAEAGVPVAGGSVEYRARVTVIYEIAPDQGGPAPAIPDGGAAGQ